MQAPRFVVKRVVRFVHDHYNLWESMS